MQSTQSTMVAVVLAVGAAASFALANVAQMRAARRAAAPEGLSPRLLMRLVRDRLWLGGLAASMLGYGCQAVALFLAPVLLVQPLIVTELLFALPLAAHLAGVRLHRREWTGAALVAGGITAFVVVGHPGGERTDIAGTTWVVIIASAAAFIATAVVLAEGRRHRPMARATLLALAASTCFGLMSVLTKVVGHQFGDHHIGALVRAQPWLLLVVAITGLLLAQTAFRIVPLSVSLPIIDVGEPLVASLIAVLAFDETIGIGVGTAVGVALSGAAVVSGIGLLDTSPVVRAAQANIQLTTEDRTAGSAPEAYEAARQ